MMPHASEAAARTSASRGQFLAVTGGLAAVAMALWLAPASVHIVGWPESGPVRVALFPSLGRLAALMFAAAAAAWGFTRIGPTQWVQNVVALLTPMNLLWTWAIPFLPWLPDRFPLVMAFAGRLRWVVAAVAVVMAARAIRPIKIFPPERATAGGGLVLALSFAIYASLGVLSARTMGPSGDEPHYLIIAHSLLSDGDLRIQNNHDQRHYRAFMQGDIPPHFLRRGQDGQIYSIHAPGLPAILLPAYAVGGYLGAVLFQTLLAALAAVAVFDLANRVGGRRSAWLAWAAVCLTVPFIPHSWLLFPEITSAFIVAVAARWLWMPLSVSPGRWVARGALVTLLPWLHAKFVVLLVGFVVLLAIRLRRHVSALVAFGMPVALGVAGWLYMFYAIYGEADPQAPYGHSATTDLQIANIPRSLFGLLLDQKFGLLFYSPVYLAAAAGSWIMIRRRETRLLTCGLLVIAAGFAASTMRYYMWWGGSSAPARFLVPILPLLAPMVAAGLEAARQPVWRALALTGMAASLTVAVGAALWPRGQLLFSPPHGRARLLEWIQGGAPLASAWPTFTEGPWIGPLVGLLPWAIAAVVSVLTMAMLFKTRTIRTAPGLSVSGALAFCTIAAVITAFPSAELRAETARRGARDLLWAYDGSRVRAFDYGALEPIDAEKQLAYSTLVTQSGTERVALPPGTYEARVWLREGGARTGDIAVGAGPQSVFGRVDGLLTSPVTIPFNLLVPTGQVTVTIDGEAAAADIERIEFVPRDLVPASERETRVARAVERIEGWPGGQIVYVDDNTFPEGGVFWTRGREIATVLVARPGAKRVSLTLFMGPRSGDVRLTIGGVEHTVRVRVDQPVTFEAALPDGLLVPVTIASPAAFRPADVDPASTDTRWLGCQVRVHLH